MYKGKKTHHLTKIESDGNYSVNGIASGQPTLRKMIEHFSKPVNGWPVILKRGIAVSGFAMGKEIHDEPDDSTTTESSTTASAATEDIASMNKTAPDPGNTIVLLDMDAGQWKTWGFGFEGPKGSAGTYRIIRIASGGCAEASGQVQVGMEIAAVNGTSLVGLQRPAVMKMIKAERKLRLELKPDWTSAATEVVTSSDLRKKVAAAETKLAELEARTAGSKSRVVAAAAASGEAPRVKSQPDESFYKTTETQPKTLSQALDSRRLVIESKGVFADGSATVIIRGRTGFADFINGHYDGQVGTMHAGLPTYRHTFGIGEGYGDASVCCSPLYYFT